MNLTEDERFFIKRMTELRDRSASRGIYTNSLFLTPAEQALVRDHIGGKTLSFEGGFADAERKIAVFGTEEDCGYSFAPPLVYLFLHPTAPKFAEDLSHRDVLGAAMNCGLRRDRLGDIIVTEAGAYLICLDTAADYFTENLTKIRHTPVAAQRVDSLPETAVKLPEISETVAASERLDALIAAVWNLSRSEAKETVLRELAAVNGAPVTDPSVTVPTGATVSLRGRGRFRYEGVLRETKSGKCRVAVRVYG